MDIMIVESARKVTSPGHAELGTDWVWDDLKLAQPKPLGRFDRSNDRYASYPSYARRHLGTFLP